MKGACAPTYSEAGACSGQPRAAVFGGQPGAANATQAPAAPPHKCHFGRMPGQYYDECEMHNGCLAWPGRNGGVLCKSHARAFARASQPHDPDQALSRV